MHTAGVLVWTNDDEELQTREAAKHFLELYTKWCNGHVYGYTVTRYEHCAHCGSDHSPVELDSCEGFYDVENILEELRPFVNEGDEIKFTGDCASLITIEQLRS